MLTIIDFLWIAISAILAAMFLCAVVVLGCCAVKLVSADEQDKPAPEQELELDAPSRAEIDVVTARLLREDRRRRRRRTRRPGNYLIR